MIYWFTGQPGHGKTVQATLLLATINRRVSSLRAFHIDGDDLRALVENKNYSREGREANIKLAQNLAQYLHNNGFDVVVSLVSPYRELREDFKTKMGKDLIEIFVHTTEQRGREQYHVEYEEPLTNFIDLSTEGEVPAQTFSKLLEELSEHDIVFFD